jgi:O-antigen/teichoic acid export membrane protein
LLSLKLMAAKLRELCRTVLVSGATALSTAAIADGALALAFTLLFARILGPEQYGSLAALVSVFLVISVAGSALQISVARQTFIGIFGVSNTATQLAKFLARAAAVTLLISVFARETLGRWLSVEEGWAAALIIPSAVLDLAVAVQRGVLLGRGAYRIAAASLVIVPAGWLIFGTTLAAAGMGVTGAIAGIAITELLAFVVLQQIIRRHTQSENSGPTLPLGKLLAEGWAPMAAMLLFAALQNADVVAVRRAVADNVIVSSYAAAAVPAKAILWIAVGLGLYLVPEVARRRGDGASSHWVLGQCMCIVVGAAVPMVTLYIYAGKELLSLVFGPGFTAAAAALPVLAAAMTLLACAYLFLQYLLASRRSAFVAFLGLGVLFQVMLIQRAAPDLQAVAEAVAIVSLAVAASLFAAAWFVPKTDGRGKI